MPRGLSLHSDSHFRRAECSDLPSVFRVRTFAKKKLEFEADQAHGGFAFGEGERVCQLSRTHCVYARAHGELRTRTCVVFSTIHLPRSSISRPRGCRKKVGTVEGARGWVAEIQTLNRAHPRVRRLRSFFFYLDRGSSPAAHPPGSSSPAHTVADSGRRFFQAFSSSFLPARMTIFVSPVGDGRRYRGLIIPENNRQEYERCCRRELTTTPRRRSRLL